MKVLPAIDLRDGACVQLVGGDYQQERVRWPDPLRAAAHWRALGFTTLHVVDLQVTKRCAGSGQVLAQVHTEPVAFQDGIRWVIARNDKTPGKAHGFFIPSERIEN